MNYVTELAIEFSMDIQSLAIQTDLIFARFAGKIIQRNNYIVVQTPSNPGYHWGNFIIFEFAPRSNDLGNWIETFKAEFPYYKTLTHMAFTWDSQEPGETRNFVDFGFSLEKSKVLATQNVKPPPHPNPDVEIRKILSDADWEAATANQIATVEVDYGPNYDTFKKRQMANYRAMQEAGLGQWYGAYINSKLVGDLGVFFENDKGRFQSVGTHPDYQRHGVCGTLVYEVSKQALLNASKLVIVADEEYHAARVYESVGFKMVEKNFQLSWWHE